jgi:ABC-type Fe3+ transport system permease subunit
MGTAEAPSEVTGIPVATRAPEHVWRSKSLAWVSTRWAVRLWHGGIVGFFLVFVLLPTLYVLGYVVADWSGVQTIFQDPILAGRILPAVEYSFGVAGMVALFDLLAGLPLAWLLVRHDFRGKSWFDTLIDSPLAVTTAGLGFSVVLFWGLSPTIVQHPPGSLGLTGNAFLILVLLHLTTTFPYMVRSLAAILQEIDIEYENAARAAGASRLTAARTITLPMFRSGMATGLLLVLAKALSDTGGALTALTLIGAVNTSSLYAPFTGNGTALIGVWKGIAGQATTTPILKTELNGGLALVSALMIVLALVLLVLVKYVAVRLKFPLRRVWPVAERRLSTRPFARVRDLGALAALVFFILVPSFFFLAFLFVATPTANLDWGRFWSAVGISFLIGGVATGIDLVTGVPLAILITRGKMRWLGRALDAMVNIPYIVPSAALGISLSLFWSAQKTIVPSFLVLVTLAHVAFTFPFVVRNVVGALEQLDPATEETARTLGAKPAQVFQRVLLPAIRPAILAGAIMAFTRSLGETGATQAVAGTNLETIPLLIVNIITSKTPQYYEAALAQLALLGVSFAAILSLRLVIERRRGHG